MAMAMAAFSRLACRPNCVITAKWSVLVSIGLELLGAAVMLVS